MTRRTFLKNFTTGSPAFALILSRLCVSAFSLFCRIPFGALAAEPPRFLLDPSLRQDWLARWEKHILAEEHNRYCDKETGEELGWLVSPFLNGFYYGYLATKDKKWVRLLCDWTDSCLKRSTSEPDGFPGWPKGDGGGGDSTEYRADSLLGEAMMLRPVVLMASEISRTPELAPEFGAKARSYISLAEQIFRKWDSRDCWREVKNGGLWIAPQFGINLKTAKWSSGYEQRRTNGFSNPDNKQNHTARWLLAMYDATHNSIYRVRAQAWFQLMRSRMKPAQDGKCFVWNYWEPAGPWDYKPDGSPKHWIGVHPNGGYYGIDVDAIVDAFEHGLVFTKDDIGRLIATNRDFMWNHQVKDAAFQRIDGRSPDPRWKNSPGVLWTALIPFDSTLREIFAANHNPANWGALASTTWFLSLAKS